MKKKVLIFDDDADILEICRYILEAMGLEVLTKQNCTNVIQDMDTFRPDIVLMDNWIPDIGGIKATQAIKNNPEYNGIPVILFSASKDVEQMVMEAKADAFIEKPFNIELLEQTIGKFLSN